MESLKMARIYLNCPGISPQGSSIYTFWRIVFVIAALVIGLLFLLPITGMFKLSGARNIEEKEGLQYAIVIDCGSSGSRVYVYFWPQHSGNPSDLLSIQQLHDSSGKLVEKKVSPGLSSFEDNPDAASDHIKDLLLFAQQYIPSKKYSETFLYVMATAGMRMLPEKKQNAILTDLRTDIKKDFNFIALENHFEVISGKQEGVFAWIAINYALNRFSHTVSHDSSEHRKRKTVGMMDMGGGSVQIAYEVSGEASEGIPPFSLSKFNLGCQDSDEEHAYKVYVTTFLGFGANSALDRYKSMLVEKSVADGHSAGTESQPITDVCLPLGMTLKTTDDAGVGHVFSGGGDFTQCKAAVEPLINKTVPCSKAPCSVNGVYQPVIDPAMEFYGFSEFWYSMEDVFSMGGHYNYDTFNAKAKEFCGTNWDTLETWYKKDNYPKADDHRFRFQCFKSAWMVEMLHKGFSFPSSYNKLTSAQLVNGRDVGWTLGALIYKTRYLPLRNVERQKDLQQSQALSTWQRMAHLPDLQFLLFVCVLVVITAIVVYMKWLRCCPRKSDLQRVPSMSYFMTDPNQMEQGIDYVKGQGFVL
ncbi:ectonucleoside triphosphate diphosphohydrolase 7 [Aplysia californica]|uniref:Ectonucleoside triphosphate diphosphohydrolase 7 n=1 Tax=Aplysia californica TaxID=6500 RepID=A0ABM0JHZ4_APLCA|nr:ectonucleoside triphosphate diphosphohydrolase 7 [Aplysia californica]